MRKAEELQRKEINYQLYDNCSDNLAWSAVSTTTISVQKFGPNRAVML